METIGEQMYQRKRQALSRVASRFVTVWRNNDITPEAEAVYPYLRTDLFTALETHGPSGARKVLVLAEHLVDSRVHNKNVVVHVEDEVASTQTLPDSVQILEVTDGWTVRNGYERRILLGRFIVDGKMATELVWHRHDGYGRAAGLVELIAYQ